MFLFYFVCNPIFHNVGFPKPKFNLINSSLRLSLPPDIETPLYPRHFSKLLTFQDICRMCGNHDVIETFNV